MNCSPWLRKVSEAVVFFAASLAVLTAVRLAFFYAYRSADLGLFEIDKALIMGLRVDAKWLAIALLPAWVLLLLARWKSGFWKAAAALALLGHAVMTLLALGNFGFYGFYGTPINPIVFGFFQDDTKAIIETFLKDWPVFQYLAAAVVGVIFPLAMARLCRTIRSATLCRKECSWKAFTVVLVVGTLVMAGLMRGSFGKFPLRQENFAVSSNTFVNALVPGGAAALHEAYKGQKALYVSGNPEDVFKAFGFRDKEDAEAAIKAVRPKVEPMPAAFPNSHVVLVVMESMGRDTLDTHRPPQNDVLGALAEEIPHGVLFRNGVSVANGTFPSLEGLLFDTPMSPLTQSRYGRQAFSFSQVLPFKKAGYRVVFLTSGPEVWRQISSNFPLQGFDEIIGSGALSNEFPNAEVGPWGMGDKWMFKKAEELLARADAKGEKLFLVMLSTTNHPPRKQTNTYSAVRASRSKSSTNLSREVFSVVHLWLPREFSTRTFSMQSNHPKNWVKVILLSH